MNKTAMNTKVSKLPKAASSTSATATSDYSNLKKSTMFDKDVNLNKTNKYKLHNRNTESFNSAKAKQRPKSKIARAIQTRTDNKLILNLISPDVEKVQNCGDLQTDEDLQNIKQHPILTTMAKLTCILNKIEQALTINDDSACVQKACLLSQKQKNTVHKNCTQ